MTGLTEISDVNGYELVGGRRIPCEGKLYYQGVNIIEIIQGLDGRRFGFEETIYLLLFGHMPTQEQLDRFIKVIHDMESLSGRFVRDVVMKASSENIMNAMQRSVLSLYTYDSDAEDISVGNVLRQSMELIAKLPVLSI